MEFAFDVATLASHITDKNSKITALSFYKLERFSPCDSHDIAVVLPTEMRGKYAC